MQVPAYARVCMDVKVRKEDNGSSNTNWFFKDLLLIAFRCICKYSVPCVFKQQEQLQQVSISLVLVMSVCLSAVLAKNATLQQEMATAWLVLNLFFVCHAWQSQWVLLWYHQRQLMQAAGAGHEVGLGRVKSCPAESTYIRTNKKRFLPFL